MKFIIYAPPYKHNSGGTTVLYNLCDDLNRIGHDCKVITFGQTTDYDPESIVIYPEVVPGNPLNASRIVRYFLHLDAYITGIPVDIGPNDFILTWSTVYYKKSHAVLYNYPITKHFHDRDTKPTLNRSIDCTWIHKGQFHTNATVIPNSIHIGGNGPLSNQGLADLLRQTRIVYSYDILTRVAYEAIFCGAVVVPLLWYPFTADQIVDTEVEFLWVSVIDNNISIPLNYNEQREKFIDKVHTVNKNYLNNLESITEQMKHHFNL